MRCVTTKTPFLWLGTALCGVLGAWVALHGGWTRYASLWAVKRTPQVVYVTNYVNAWDQPLKPLEEEPHAPRITIVTNPWYVTNVDTPMHLEGGNSFQSNVWIIGEYMNNHFTNQNPGHYHNVYIYGSNNIVNSTNYWK